MSKPSSKSKRGTKSEDQYPPAGEPKDKWVFINISTDEDYRLMRQAIIFTLAFMRFWPRSTSEKPFGAEEVRFEKIIELIHECKYSLHDLSCIEPDPINNLPRFNMPLELGLAFGNKRYADANKEVFVLDGLEHQFRKCCSDLECFDFPHHNKNPDQVVKAIRNWLDLEVPPKFPKGNFLVQQYHDFCEWLVVFCEKEYHLKPEELTFKDLVNMSLAWAGINALAPSK